MESSSIRQRHSSSASSSSAVSERESGSVAEDSPPPLRQLILWGNWLSSYDSKGTSLPSMDSIYQIACGSYHVMILMDDGSVWAMGLNHHYSCGIGHDRPLYSFQKISLPDYFTGKIIAITCGPYHTFFLSNDGSVYGCGRNDYYQLGVGNSDSIVRSITKLSFNGLGEGIRITSISTSYTHSVFTDSVGRVWTCGDGRCGQLGYIDCDEQRLIDGLKYSCQSIPRLIQQWDSSMPIPHITSTACGLYFTLALSKQGLLYSFGSNAGGALGLGISVGEAKSDISLPSASTEESFVIPRIISSLASEAAVKRISASDYHAFAITKGGRLSGWGSGSRSALGVGSLRTEISPYALKKFRSIKISQIATASTHSVAISNDGYLFTWGENDEGLTGHKQPITQIDNPIPPSISDSIPYTPALSRQLVPVPPRCLSSHRALAVSVGDHITAVIYEERTFDNDQQTEPNIEDVKPILPNQLSPITPQKQSQQQPWRHPVFIGLSLLMIAIFIGVQFGWFNEGEGNGSTQ